MPGRRPENPILLVAQWVDDRFKDDGSGQYVHRYATTDEIIAAVRRGVESGTIKGEVVELPDSLLPNAEPGAYVVIGPVSGGEDR